MRSLEEPSGGLPSARSRRVPTRNEANHAAPLRLLVRARVRWREGEAPHDALSHTTVPPRTPPLAAVEVSTGRGPSTNLRRAVASLGSPRPSGCQAHPPSQRRTFLRTPSRITRPVPRYRTGRSRSTKVFNHAPIGSNEDRRGASVQGFTACSSWRICADYLASCVPGQVAHIAGYALPEWSVWPLVPSAVVGPRTESVRGSRERVLGRRIYGLGVEMVELECAGCLFAAEPEDVEPFGDVCLVDEVVVPVRRPGPAEIERIDRGRI